MKKRTLFITAAAIALGVGIAAAISQFHNDAPPEMGMPPGGMQGNPPPKPPGAGTGKTEGTVSSTGILHKDSILTLTDKTFTSNGEDEVAIKVTGGKLILTNCTINKTGSDSSEEDGTSFFGINSALLTTKGGTTILNEGTITTDAVGANAIVAYGGKVIANKVNIDCSKRLSRGVHATFGGSIIANDVTISTAGDNSSAIATDRGGGTVTFNDGKVTVKGKDSAVAYSTGKIIVNGTHATNEQGEIAVVEGSNSLQLNDCDITSGDERRGMLILQSGSGDAEGFRGVIQVTGGKLAVHQNAPLVEVATSTDGTLALDNVTLDVPSGVLMLVDYNKRWNTNSPVGHLILLSTKGAATYAGNVVADSYGTATVKVAQNVTWNGAINSDNQAKSASAEIIGNWNLTNDCHLDTLVIQQGGIVNRNGHNLTYKSLDNNGSLR